MEDTVFVEKVRKLQHDHSSCCGDDGDCSLIDDLTQLLQEYDETKTI